MRKYIESVYSKYAKKSNRFWGGDKINKSCILSAEDTISGVLGTIWRLYVFIMIMADDYLYKMTTNRITIILPLRAFFYKRCEKILKKRTKLKTKTILEKKLYNSKISITGVETVS